MGSGKGGAGNEVMQVRTNIEDKGTYSFATSPRERRYTFRGLEDGQ